MIETNSTVENLKAALGSGFGVEWNANSSLCDECQNSGGHCGYNPGSVISLAIAGMDPFHLHVDQVSTCSVFLFVPLK